MIGRKVYEYRDVYTPEIRRRKGDSYLGRSIITQDMDVRGALHYELVSRESVIVDYYENPEVYQEYYDEVLWRIQSTASQEAYPYQVADAVFATVASRMCRSEEAARRILQDARKAGRHSIELSTFMREGVGICRHCALVSAALFERLKEECHIDGQISVDKIDRTNTSTGEGEGHSWVRFTPSGGAPWVVDVAGEYSGLLKGSYKVTNWDYRRHEEKLSTKIGKTAASGFAGLQRFFSSG